MADVITWTNETRRLRELIPWPINPATIGKDEAKRLEESLSTFGQVQSICISPTDEIYDGHQRQTVWGASAKFGMDYEVDVRVSSRPLTEDERKKLVIYLRKGTVGSFDFDLLANNFDVPDLLEWGFKGFELGLVGDAVDYAEAWKGMPEFQQKDLSAIKSIVIHFQTQDDIDNFSELVEQTITEKTKYIYYPKKERADLLALVSHES